MDNKDLKELWESVRMEFKLTQKQVAEYLNYKTEGAYRKKINNIHTVTLADINNLCSLYNLPIEYILMTNGITKDIVMAQAKKNAIRFKNQQIEINQKKREALLEQFDMFNN